MKLTTTLDLLHKNHACEPRYKVLLTGLGLDYPHDKPINLLTILDICGLDDALWALCATAENCDKIARLMAADFAEQVLPIWQKYSNSKVPELAIKATRDFANGLISREEFTATAAAADAADAAAAAVRWATAARWAAAAADAAAVRWADAAARVKQREIFVSYLQA